MSAREVIWYGMRASVNERWMICARAVPEREKVSGVTVSLWDLLEMRHVADLDVAFDGSFVISPNGEFIGCGYDEGVSMLTRTGDELWRVNRNHVGRLDFWDGARIGIAGDLDYEIREVATGKVIARPPIFEVFLSSMRSEYLAVDKLYEVFRVVDANGRTERVLFPMKGWAAEVAYHPEKDLAFVSEHDGPFRCIDMHTAEVLWEVPFSGMNRSWVRFVDGALVTYQFDHQVTGLGRTHIVDPTTGKTNKYVGGVTHNRFEVVVSQPLRRIFSFGDVFELKEGTWKLVTTVRVDRNGEYHVTRR